MERKEVISLFREIAKELGLEGVVKIRIVPMKRKIASFSFKTGILRINRNVIEIFDKKLIRFVIFHELIHFKVNVHFKVNDVNHGKEFFKELGRYYSEESMENLEIEIIKRILNFDVTQSLQNQFCSISRVLQ